MAIDAGPAIPGQKKRINWSNIALGGIMNMFEVSSSAHPAHAARGPLSSPEAQFLSANTRRLDLVRRPTD